MTTQTTLTSPTTVIDTTDLAITTPVPSTGGFRGRRRLVPIVAAALIAATAFTVTVQVRGDDGPKPVVAQPATEADLRLAAEWAHRMAVLAPEYADASPNPATERDLLIAAEWARKMRVAASKDVG
jgi:hypothetical protein